MYCTQNLGHKIGGAVFMSKILVNEKNIVFSCIVFNFYYFETTSFSLRLFSLQLILYQQFTMYIYRLIGWTYNLLITCNLLDSVGIPACYSGKGK